ncbi:peroxisomal-coenzyme A synthetase [Aspergillus niger ATCC 13496]|uniref:Peroxisomal-coenzyme A synthetase n=1 Tax=Aspergillus niger ATCC 13496 TaxID=1353008 RepID=A0A370BKT5_ASPNG|nr:peroxisomal-coenzyme A synthetase [Aspergillus niger CBS 513.88]RDH16077.1 peroxisomal-coenzyme A synthetase [Aspergillus niger ATCC 13496]|eukprot:XP_001389107.2 peroxisomal-coenzyme A synthetase [Aspergillus niger CBS 513.88]
MTYDDKPSAAANLPPVLALPAEGSERPAVIIPSTKNAPSTVVSYKDLNESVTRVQSTLAQFGVGEGTRVALVLPNGLEFVGSFLAVIRQRATAAPLNPQYKREELKDILRLMRPSLLISMKSTHLISASVLAAQDLAIPVAICRTEGPNIYIEGEHSSSGAESHVPIHSPYDLRPSDKAVLLFTSGTTGAPKSVALSHENLLVAMRIIIDAHKLSPADRCMIITPLFHIIGVGGSLLTSLFSGGCVIIPPALPGQFWQSCIDLNATWFHAVPTLYRLLISFPRPDVMPKLRFIRSGGSDLSPELYQRLHELGTQVIEVYGMTETAPAIFCNRLDSSMRRLAHYPIASTVEVMILPSEGRAGNHPDAGRLTNEPGIVGEICVRGKSIMTGYLDNPKANEQAFLFGGFFRTGDLGVVKEHGYLQLTGRIKEIINKGGEKISPSEIEHVASSFEGVRESVCFRIPDEIYGEEVGVAAVIEVGKQVTEAALKKHFRQHVAMFKVPKAVFFVDTIPTNRTGKPLRSLLSEQYVQGLFAIRPQK